MRGANPFLFFFFNDTATTEIYTLSLHDALPILRAEARLDDGTYFAREAVALLRSTPRRPVVFLSWRSGVERSSATASRSEEHTSELQSHLNLVCRLLLEKKKNRYSHS